MPVVCFIALGSILLYGQESDSPRFVKYLGTWGEMGAEPLQFKEPQGISADPNGFLYVADTGNQRIQKLDTSGEFVFEIGGFGWDKEQFDGPMTVVAPNGLDVFVVDHFNQRIERYDKDLHFLVGRPGLCSKRETQDGTKDCDG